MKYFLFIFVLISVPLWADNTTFNPPSAEKDDYASGLDYGAGDGYANDGSDEYSLFSDSYPILHDFYNYGFSIPVGSTIDSITFMCEGFAEDASNTNTFAIELSWNGGTSYTSAGNTLVFGERANDTIFGGTWGRTWSASEFSDANFRVRYSITQTTGNAYSTGIDYTELIVYYTTAAASGSSNILLNLIPNNILLNYIAYEIGGPSATVPTSPFQIDMAHTQNALIPDNADSLDYVVELKRNMNLHWADLTFSEYSGDTSLIQITDSTMLTNTTSLTVGDYQIVYKVEYGVLWDTASVFLHIADADNCTFVDLDAASAGSGTRASPYHNFGDFAYGDNDTILFKRGTNITITSYEELTADGDILGAYGTGSRPNIVNNGDYGNSIGAFHINGVTSLTIRDIDLYNQAGAIAMLSCAGTNTDVIIDNCIIAGALGATWNQIRYSSGSITGGGIKNCNIYNSLDDGVYIHNTCLGNSSSDRFKIEACFIHHTNTGDFSGDGIDMSVGDHRHFHILYCLVDKTNVINKHGILYGSTHANQYESCDGIVEFNRVLCYPNDINQNAISLYHVREVICRYNETNWGNRSIFTPTQGITDPDIWATWDPRGRKMEIYGNLCVNSLFAVIDLQENCDSTDIYNNTGVNHSQGSSPSRSGFRINGATDVNVKNNILHALSGDQIDAIAGSCTEDYNLFSPDAGGWSAGAHSIEDDPEFATGDHSAYEIESNSPAYQAGTDVGLTEDLWGTGWGATPSMGYKEVTE